MKAAILAIGSELLGTDRLDSNSLQLTRALRRFGVELGRKTVVGDVVDDIAAQVETLLAEFDLVLVTGGLGPTADDVTRQAVASALGRALRIDAAQLDEIRAKFARFNLAMPEVNKRQAEVLEGATVLSNSHGTAPGMLVEHQGRVLFLLPGVPQELDGLVRSALEPWLASMTGGEVVETCVLKVACLAESRLEEMIAPAYEEFGRETISILAGAGDIQVALTVRGTAAERQSSLDEIVSRVKRLIGDAVYSTEASGSLEQVVGQLLRRRGCRVVTAESCTGGLIAGRLTAVPGSSDYFLGGVVTYTNQLKEQLVGVPKAELARFGAVSEEVVCSMAQGALATLGGDFSIAVSGIAGPGGGTKSKPVGLVHIAIAERRSGQIDHRRVQLPGDRERVRLLASQWALDLLRRRLLIGASPGSVLEAEQARACGERRRD
jgi:nicotinamide-nucleotide amidase